MGLIDHVNVPVERLDRSRGFYEAVLATLGYRLIAEYQQVLGFGRSEWSFGVVETKPPFSQLHVAFSASTREQVDQFFEVGLREGGRSNGGPGVREAYHPDYYAAFVRDPDGHNVEAVCRDREGKV